MTTSVISAMNISPSGCSLVSSVFTGPAGMARPAIFASPGHSFSLPFSGWKVGPCSAKRGSRLRSAPLRAPVIEPKRRSPSVNSHSIPEMRGEPSARPVAIVLWRPASNNVRTRLANSGSACSMAFHAGTAAQRTRMSKPLVCGPRSDRHDFEIGVETTEVVGVGRDDSLTAASGADDDVGIGNVGGAATGQQASDVGRVDTIEGHDIGRGLTDQARQPSLPFGTTYRLGQNARRDGHPNLRLGGPGQQNDHPPVVTVQSDE